MSTRPSPGDSPRFAHASEAELARILDYYQVEWLYEPHVFPIRWNTDGMVVESFAPDFYLPGLDLYLELTTLKQSLVRRKNRKLRHLRDLYPMIRIKLFYARDFRALMLKYGRIEAAASLIGIDGQPPPKRISVAVGGAAATAIGAPVMATAAEAGTPVISVGDAGLLETSTAVGEQRPAHRPVG